MSPFRLKIVQLCEQELDRWRGAEADPACDPWCSIVGDYWSQGLGVARRDGRTVYFDDTGRHFRPAWSAAFVAYVMRHAGAGDAFHYSEAHFHYIMASVRASCSRGQRHAFVARSPDLHVPRQGDLLCTIRSGRDYRIEDLEQLYGELPIPEGRFVPCHADIVVETGEAWVRTIGGNFGIGRVEDRLWQRDANGRVVTRPLLCILECML